MPIDVSEDELSHAFSEMLRVQNAAPGHADRPETQANDVGGALPSGDEHPNPATTTGNTDGPDAAAQLRDSVEPLIKILEPHASTEEATQWMDTILAEHGHVMESLGESSRDKLPVALIPEHVRDDVRPDPATNETMYDAREYSTASIKGVAGFIARAMRLIDAVKTHTDSAAMREQPSPAPLPSAPSSSTAPPPDLAQNLSAAISRTDRLSSTLSNAFGGDWVSREMKRELQGNELYLGSIALHLSLRLQSMPESSPDYRELQSSFGRALLDLYELSHEDHRLDEGVGAVSLALRGDADGIGPTTMVRVCNWAYSQRLLARREQNFEILQPAVEVAKCTLDVSRALYPGVSENLSSLALELAECLLDRYRAEGQAQYLQDALELLPKSGGESDMQDVQTLCVLSELYLERFLRTWDMADIDKALFYTANLPRDEPLIGHLPSQGTPAHPDDARSLHVSALVRAQRFKVVMDAGDLDADVTFARQAVKKCPESHPLYVVYLTDLALLLQQRFEADEDIKDLDECVERLSIAAHLPIAGTYAHYPAQAALGLALASRGEHTENLAEVDEGMRQLQLARRAFSGGAHLEAQIERDLATALFYRFQLTQSSEDLDEAIRYASSALERAPVDDQRCAALGLELGMNLALRADIGRSAKDADAATRALRSVAESPARASIRINAAMEWAKIASARGPEATLEALKVALDVLPLLAWAGNRMVIQYKTLARLSADVGPWAAACAIACGRLDDAVSYLERGRNVLWSQSLQLRLPKNLSASGSPAPSAELDILSAYLSNTAEGMPKVTPAMMEEAAKRRPELVKTVENLRAVYEGMRANAMAHPGYRPGDFDRIDGVMSLMKSIQGDAAMHSAATRRGSLQAALAERNGDAASLAVSGDLRHNAGLASVLKRGCVVFLNAHTTRCDAIVLSRSRDGTVALEHVPLPELSVEEIRGWAEAIQVGLYDLQQGGMGVRDFDEVIMIPILQGLWKAMAEPVLAHLRQRSQLQPLRVWWCPTGPLALLPIHAAGPYNGDAPGLPELIVSSYIPTLHSLLRAHNSAKQPFSLLAVGQPDTPGQNPLPAVHNELSTIQRACERLSRTPTTLVGAAATAHSVASALPAHTWLHLSCHAYQDPSYAFASAFFMHDGPLQLGALMRLDLSRVQLAFLSACLTSAGDERLPDESIHLAAGLQFAGVRSAVATLWTVDDRTSAFIADKVYGHLTREGVGEPDPSEAAEALHKAVRMLKAAGKPTIFWVPFIHTGR